jgi:hypothetical protein
VIKNLSMDSSFWVGKCVWDTLMVLWKKFGESILSIYGVTRIAKSDATDHRCAGPDRADCPPSPRGRSARPRQPHLCLVALWLGFQFFQ